MAEEEAVHISEYGKDHVVIGGLTEQESEQFRGALNGQWWVKGNGDGRLHFSPGREATPAPAADENMMPFWRPFSSGSSAVQMELLDSERMHPVFSPSIMVTHLCGYYFTPEKYKEQAEKLESWGFSCLRSRRGDDGKFWEIWYLPGLWTAKGKLRDVLVDSKGEKENLEAAIKFLSRHSSFGSLDVVVQRMAMTMED